MNTTRVPACALSAATRTPAQAFRRLRHSHLAQPKESGKGRVHLVLVAGIVLGFIVTIFSPQLVDAWLVNRP